MSSLLCVAFAASLHASVPGAVPAARFKQSPPSALLDQSRVKQGLPITAVPADTLSFYPEFYGADQLLIKAEHKGGFLHWFTSAVKKTAQKVNFLPN